MPAFDIKPTKPIPLKGFAPDQDPLTPGILLATNNAVPTVKGYRALASPQPISQALPSTPLGSVFPAFSDGTFEILAGTDQHIYRLNFLTGAWDECDNGQTYGGTGRWRFIQFADDVIALRLGELPQVAHGNGAQFGPLGGLPVHAGLGISVGGFVVLFDGTFWYSSAAGADDNWIPDVQTLAATGALYDYPGRITAAAQLFRNMIIFKQTSMWLGGFAGPPNTWDFHVISDSTGTWGQECVIPMADSLAFIGSDDFYVTNGYAPNRIPDSPKNWFFRLVQKERLGETYGWFDTLDSVLYWHFATKTAPAGLLDHYVAFGLRSQRWAEGSMMVPCVPYPLNRFPFSPDTPTLFDTNNILQQLSGTPGLMTLQTGYVGVPGQLSQLQGIHIEHGEGTHPEDAQCIPLHVSEIGTPPIASPPAVRSAGGWYRTRQYDRYHKVIVTTTGDCEVVSLAWALRPGGDR